MSVEVAAAILTQIYFDHTRDPRGDLVAPDRREDFSGRSVEKIRQVYEAFLERILPVEQVDSSYRHDDRA